MKRRIIVLFLLLAFCGENNEISDQQQTSNTEPSETTETSEVQSTTTTEIVQLNSFENIRFVIEKEKC